jgi:hypothetical protein
MKKMAMTSPKHFSETIPEQFIVTEKELDWDAYDQFLAFSEEIDSPADRSALLRQGGELAGSAMPTAQKKLVLAQLAQWGTAEAYRLVQEYCTRPDPALVQWSRIALYECQMRLEQELLDEPVGLISTGLGGDGQRLRYIFVLVLLVEASADGTQQEMREALDTVCQQHRSFVEQAQFQASCLHVQVLVPLDVAVGKVIEESIVLLNEKGERFRQEYLTTNVSVPTDEEVQEFLDDLQPEG